MADFAAAKKTWAIVGASRGLGHEFVKQLLPQGHQVIATVRNTTLPLAHMLWKDSDSGRCHIYECDVLSPSSIATFVAKLANDGIERIDYLVLNAGVLRYPNRATELTYDDFAFHLHSNTIGPIICAQSILKQNVSVGTLAFISSDSGSAQEFRDMEDEFAAYAASKAALNQMLRHMAAELKRKNSKTVVIALHPGEVATEMANVDLGWTVEGQMTPAESVSACLPVITSKTVDDSGTFWTWRNEPYPW